MAPIAKVVGLVAIALGALGGQDGFERERSGSSDAAKNSLEGNAPPSLEAGEWLNVSEKLDWTKLKGKVVLLDFWAHWCGPCKAATPHVKELISRFGPKGLVVIGIHSDPNKEKMIEVAKSLGMSYPLLFDGGKSIMKAYAADSYPDYYLVDRKGVLRFADLANKEVDRAVEALLAESP